MTETATIGQSAQRGSISRPNDIFTVHDATRVEFVEPNFMSIETLIVSVNLLTGQRIVAPDKGDQAVLLHGSMPTESTPIDKRGI